MKVRNNKNNTNTFKKHGIISVIMKWYVITIIKTIDKIKVTNLIPIKNLKQLKKLFSILSPSIKYAKIS